MDEPDANLQDDWLPSDPELAAILRAARALAADRIGQQPADAEPEAVEEPPIEAEPPTDEEPPDEAAPMADEDPPDESAFDRLRAELRQEGRDEATGLRRLWQKLTGRGGAGKS